MCKNHSHKKEATFLKIKWTYVIIRSVRFFSSVGFGRMMELKLHLSITLKNHNRKTLIKNIASFACIKNIGLNDYSYKERCGMGDVERSKQPTRLNETNRLNNRWRNLENKMDKWQRKSNPISALRRHTSDQVDCKFQEMLQSHYHRLE